MLIAEEEATPCSQNGGVRQSARITFTDNTIAKPRGKRGSLSAQVLEKNTAASTEDERIVEGQVSSNEIKIEGL